MYFNNKSSLLSIPCQCQNFNYKKHVEHTFRFSSYCTFFSALIFLCSSVISSSRPFQRNVLLFRRISDGVKVVRSERNSMRSFASTSCFSSSKMATVSTLCIKACETKQHTCTWILSTLNNMSMSEPEKNRWTDQSINNLFSRESEVNKFLCSYWKLTSPF